MIVLIEKRKNLAEKNLKASRAILNDMCQCGPFNHRHAGFTNSYFVGHSAYDALVLTILKKNKFRLTFQPLLP